MKLLFVIKTLAAQPGGAERVIAQISSGLAQRGHEVTLVTFDGPARPDLFDIDSRVRRIWLSSCPTDTSMRLPDAIRTIRNLRSLARNADAEVAIGFMHSAYVLLALAFAGSRVPVVGSEHTSIAHFQSRPMQQLLVRVTAPLMSRMTVPAETVKAAFPTAIARRMAVLFNPVVGATKGDRPDRRAKRLLTIGRLSQEKRHSVLLQAFAKVAGIYSDWDLRIVGDGDLRDQLHDEARRLGLASRVQFLGILRDVGPELVGADLYVAPSAYESFGVAMAEALASGVPAVGFSDCPGINELIRDSVNGVLVDPGEDRVETLANALSELMSSDVERERLARAAPSSVQDYTLDGAVDRWESLLAGIAAGRQSTSQLSQ